MTIGVVKCSKHNQIFNYISTSTESATKDWSGKGVATSWKLVGHMKAFPMRVGAISLGLTDFCLLDLGAVIKFQQGYKREREREPERKERGGDLKCA